MDLTQQTAPAAALAPHPASVTATIDTLVLRGFPPMNRVRVQEAFSGELARLLRESPRESAAWTAGSRSELPALRLKFHSQPNPRTVGRALARAIFNGIARKEEAPP